MARYELTGPDGARYEVMAPDEATEDEVLARFQKEVGRPKSGGPDRALRRTVSHFSLGLLDRPRDAWTAAANVALGREGAAPTFGEEYESQRAKTKAALANEDLNLADVAADTAGLTAQAIASAPLSVARTAGEVVKEAGRFGAAFGTAGGYAHTPDEAGTGETLANMGVHAVAGNVLGRGLAKGQQLLGEYVAQPIGNFFRGRKAERAQRAGQVAQDFAEAGIGEPPAYTMAGPGVQGTASGLAGTVFGSSVRAPAAARIAELEAAVAREIEAAGGTATPAEVGRRVQEFLRKQLVERSTPGDVIERMSPLELQDISGIAPRADYNPPPPRVAPTAAREVAPITPEAYLDEIAQGVPAVAPRAVASVEGRYREPTIEDVELPPDLVKRLQKSASTVADLQRRIQAEQQVQQGFEAPLQESMRQLGLVNIAWSPNVQAYVARRGSGSFFLVHHTGDLSPSMKASEAEAQLARDAVSWLNQQGKFAEGLKKQRESLAAAQYERDVVAREAEAFRVERLPALAQQRRAEAMAQAEAEAGSEAALATQRAREEAVNRARPSAVQDAIKRTEQLRAEAEQRAAAETAARQGQAEAEFAAELAARKARASEPFRMGRSSESYPTELDAAYAAARQQAPAVQRNFLGTKNEPPTNVATELDRIAAEARGRGQMRGYRDGQPFDDKGRLDQQIVDYLRPRLGDDVTNMLVYMSEHRARGLFTPAVQGKQDIRTLVGQKLREHEQRPIPGAAPRTTDEAMLARLYKAIDRDIDAFVTAAGPRGSQYRQTRSQVDAAYEQYVNDIRRPLAKVFGDNVDPGAALAELTRATQNGAKNVQTLEAFYRVVGDKGDHLAATGWLLNGMARGGLEGFLTAYRALSPDARRLMSQGPAAELVKKLDAMARAGGHLERYIKSSRGDFKVDLRPSNVGLALVGYTSIPLLLKGALGAEATARLISSRWFGGWLKAFPVEKGPKSIEWQRHVQRLVVLAREDLNIPDATARGLYELLASPARAAPAGPIGDAGPPARKDGEYHFQAGDDSMEITEESRKAGDTRGPDAPLGVDHNDQIWFHSDAVHEAQEEARTSLRKITFGGRGARTADRAALAKAEEMAAGKAEPGEIWKRTGWFLDQDGVWRNEIDDSKASIRRPDFGGKTRIKVKVGDVLDHPDLFAAYPWLASFPIELVDKDYLDRKSKMRGETEEPDPKQGIVGFSRVAMKRSDKELIELVLHEIQHAIDPHEGADYGPRDEESYDTAIGEVRARNVEERRGMSAEDRRQRHPHDTQPVPPEDVELSKRREPDNALRKRRGKNGR